MTVLVKGKWNLGEPFVIDRPEKPGSVSLVATTVTWTVKVVFNSRNMVTLDSVSVARLIDAVRDRYLAPTPEFDIILEDWLEIQDDVEKILQSHGFFKCAGLTEYKLCDDCTAKHKDPTFGQRLGIKLAFLEAEERNK